MAYPAGMYAFIEKCSGTANVFTLKKFTDDPQTIAFVTSINVLFGILLAPVISYLSDSIGCRRKPFMIPGLVVLTICLFVLPNTNTLAATIFVIILYQMSVDIGFNSIWRPLYADIIPDKKRQYGMVCNRYTAIAARLLFMFFLIGRFDKGGKGKSAMKKAALSADSFISGLTGEQLIYYIAALFVIGTIILLLFIREKPGESHRKIFSVKSVFVTLLEKKEYRKIYMLILAASLMKAKLGSIWPLMVTEQFHLSKQSLGNIHSITMVFSMAVTLPIAAYLVNRIDRWRLFFVCIIVSTMHPILFWCYINFISASPGVPTIVCFQLANAAADHIGFIALWPLIFEFIPSDRRGKINAGVLFITSIVTFITSNAVAFVVKTCGRYLAENVEYYDYSVGWLVIFIAGIAGCFIAFKAKLR